MRPNAAWRDYFDDDYFRIHDPLFSEADSRHEVAAMRELLGLHDEARILDVACGWGRHTALFAESGHQAFGIDLSYALLYHAEPQGRRDRSYHAETQRRRDRSCAPCYAAADARALPFADGSFDAVINVFTSLGLFTSDRDYVAALREARRMLVPGGRFLLETMHRDEVVSEYAERDRWTLPDGTCVEVQRRFDPVTGISHEHLRWRRRDRSGEKVHSLQLRSATEIARLLHAAGFRDVAYYGGWDGEAFDRNSERLIAVARARRS